MAQLQNSDFDGELEAVWPEDRTAAGNAAEIAVLGALQGGPAPVSALKARLSAEEGTALDAMLGAGKLRRIALTPTDLICAAGGYAPGLRQASEKILSFYAGRLGVSEEEAAVWLRTAVRRKLGGSILQAGLSFHSPDGLQETRSEAAELLLRGGTELLHLRPRLEAPLVVIGAPSAAWADGIRKIYEFGERTGMEIAGVQSIPAQIVGLHMNTGMDFRSRQAMRCARRRTGCGTIRRRRFRSPGRTSIWRRPRRWKRRKMRCAPGQTGWAAFPR